MGHQKDSILKTSLYNFELVSKRLGLKEDAIKYYDGVIKYFPDSTMAVQAKFEKAETLVELGHYEDARRLFLKIIKEYPHSEYYGMSYFELAESYNTQAENIAKELNY